MNEDRIINPGSTLGVFGGGQLGRMFAVAAAKMGYRTIVYSPESDCPAAQVANEHIHAPYDDDAKVVEFAQKCDAVTIEFENVPVHCLNLVQQYAPVRPGPAVLGVAQDRLLEREFLRSAGSPCSPHVSVKSLGDLNEAVGKLGVRGVLKSARDGYDGKGQVQIAAETDLKKAWDSLGTDRAIYELWVEYECEISVLVARSRRGEIETFGPIQNHHENHILDLSVIPAGIDRIPCERAVSIAIDVAERLSLEGLICVEMFVTRKGELLINELAPRPHNSGHLTTEASTTSQFEQQVRAMCNLPLGAMKGRSAAAMTNLLGDLWHAEDQVAEVNWESVLSSSDVHLHLYGKPRPRVGRKMGHLTVLAATPQEASVLALSLRDQCDPSIENGNDTGRCESGGESVNSNGFENKKKDIGVVHTSIV